MTDTRRLPVLWRLSLLMAAVLLLAGAGAAQAQDSSATEASSSLTAETTSASSSSSTAASQKESAGWHTAADGGRYYVDASTGKPRTGFFKVSGYWYYSPKSDGYVVTGTYKYATGKYLLASKTGKLRSKAGFVTTSAYSSDGSSQRYYLVALKGHAGIYVTKTGFFRVKTGKKKYLYYGIPSTGYLVRGTYRYSTNRVLLGSPKAGHLRTKTGWITTSSYTSGSTKRTFYVVCIDKKHKYYAAKTGFFKVSTKVKGKKKTYRYYGIPTKGYILKGVYRYSSTLTLVASRSTGRLPSKSGWVTSSAYSKGSTKHTFRLRTVPGHKGYYAARVGFFKVSGHKYYGMPSKGYIRKNSIFKVSGKYYRASSKGYVSAVQLVSTNTAQLQGIDVSSYQAKLNLAKVEADFVLIKATGGTSYTNPYYTTMAQQALSSGKLIGFYHYASGVSTGTSKTKAKKAAKAEADYFIKKVNKTVKTSSGNVNLIGNSILVLDWEGDALQSGVTYAKAFLDRVKSKTGVTPIIYMSKDVTRTYNWSSVAKTYPLWAAEYAYGTYSDYKKYMGYTSGYMEEPWTDSYGFGAWSNGPLIYQYMSVGHLSGYSGDLDLDTFYGDISDWLAYCKKN